MDEYTRWLDSVEDNTRVIDLNKTVPKKDPNESIIKELRNIYKELHELNKNLRRIK